MVQSVQNAYHRLADCEIETARLKQQLENEKQSMIQLVHWKATNMKKEEQIIADVKLVEAAGKINIGSLLSRLEAARTTLDELKETTEELDEEIEKSVRKPMRKAERVRSQIQATQIQRTEAIHGRRPQIAFAALNPEALEDVVQQNADLSVRNERLQQQIDALEQAIGHMPKKKAVFVEDLLPVPKQVSKRPPTSRRTRQGRITRPKTSYVPGRPGPDMATRTERR
jgi:chromosome segregation ATPase